MFTVRNKVHKVETRVCAETNIRYFANPVRKGMIIGDVCLGDRPPWLKLRQIFLSDKVKGLMSVKVPLVSVWCPRKAQLILTKDWEELLSTKLRVLEKTASIDETSAQFEQHSKVLFSKTTCEEVFRDFIHRKFPYHAEVWQYYELWTVNSEEQRTPMHCPMTACQVKKEWAFL